MSGHTKGSWAHDSDGDIIAADGSYVVYGHGGQRGVSSDEDAQLIAAAPDLLEALEQALDALAHCKADVGYASKQNRAAQAAHKAIAKARGEK